MKKIQILLNRLQEDYWFKFLRACIIVMYILCSLIALCAAPYMVSGIKLNIIQYWQYIGSVVVGVGTLTISTVSFNNNRRNFENNLVGLYSPKIEILDEQYFDYVVNNDGKNEYDFVFRFTDENNFFINEIVFSKNIIFKADYYSLRKEKIYNDIYNKPPQIIGIKNRFVKTNYMKKARVGAANSNDYYEARIRLSKENVLEILSFFRNNCYKENPNITYIELNFSLINKYKILTDMEFFIGLKIINDDSSNPGFCLTTKVIDSKIKLINNNENLKLKVFWAKCIKESSRYYKY